MKIGAKTKRNTTCSKIEVVCAWCGKMKKVKPYTYHRNQRFFCDGSGNSNCRRSWESVFKTGEDNHAYSQVKVACEFCGKEKTIKKSKYNLNRFKRFYCNVGCQAEWMKVNNKPEQSTLWKGGVKSLDVPLYDTYANQIDYIVACRRSLLNNEYLEIKCSLCGEWHIPSLAYLRISLSRFKLNGTHLNLYCSEECKEACPVFRQRKAPKGFNKASFRLEVLDPQLNQMVLDRDDHTCIKCGSKEDLNVHHIEGVAQSPITANDIDNCITVCRECHKAIHSTPGCTYFDYRRESCLNEINQKQISM